MNQGGRGERWKATTAGNKSEQKSLYSRSRLNRDRGGASWETDRAKEGKVGESERKKKE